MPNLLMCPALHTALSLSDNEELTEVDPLHDDEEPREADPPEDDDKEMEADPPEDHQEHKKWIIQRKTKSPWRWIL